MLAQRLSEPDEILAKLGDVRGRVQVRGIRVQHRTADGALELYTRLDRSTQFPSWWSCSARPWGRARRS